MPAAVADRAARRSPAASRSWPTCSPSRPSGRWRSWPATRSRTSGARRRPGGAGRGARRAGVRRAAARHRRVPPAHPLCAGHARPGRPRPSPPPSPATSGCCSSAARPSWRTRTPTARRCPPASSCCSSRPDPAQLGRSYAGPPRRGRRPARRRSRRCVPLVAARADAGAAAGALAGAAGPAAGRDRAPRADGAAPLRRRPDRPDGRRPRPGAGHAGRTAPSSTRPSPPASTCAASTTGPSPTATSSARAAGSAGACRPRSACRLAHGGEPVLCVVGDGSAMYSPQALWTAAHEQLPVVFAVVNNRQYLILKNYLRGMGGAPASTGQLRGHGPRRPGRRLRRASPVDGRRRHAGGRTPPTSATPCAPRWRRAARTCSRSPSPRRLTGGAALALRGVRRGRATARAILDGIDWDGARRRAVGGARAATARARPRCCASRRCTCTRRRATVEVLGERLGRVDVRDAADAHRRWLSRRSPTSCGRRSTGPRRRDDGRTPRSSRGGTPTTTTTASGRARCSTASACGDLAERAVRHAVVGRAPARAAGPHPA